MRTSKVLVSIIAGALIAIISPTLAHAAPGDNQYGFQNYKSGMMIQPDRNADGSDSAASYVKMVQRPMVIWGTDLKSAQNWRISDIITSMTGEKHITAGNSSLRLGINGGSPNPGVSAIQAPADLSQNQKWRFQQAFGFPDGVIQIVNVRSGLCLGVDGASTLSGAWILQFPCDLSVNQSWRKIDR